MSRWSTETHTFVAVRGELSLSLKDVAKLTSLPSLGEDHATGITLKEEDQKKVDYVTKSLSSSKYATKNANLLLL